MSRDPWWDAVLKALLDEDLDLEFVGERAELLVWGMPTDIDLQLHRVAVRYVLRTRHGPMPMHPLVRSGELGFDCIWNQDRAALEPVLPATLMDVADPRTRAFLAWIDANPFQADVTSARSLIVRSPHDGRVIEETTLHRQVARLEDPVEAARLAAETLWRIPGFERDEPQGG